MWPFGAKGFQQQKLSRRVAVKRAKPFVEPLSLEALQRRLKKLVKAGKLPSLEELSAAVLESRKKYANKIRRARREAERKVAVN
jgi:hypothetical protein